MSVLYRKYRPQNFSEVVGQEYIIRALQNSVAAGKPAHAYLFTGSRGVGKTSIARIFAKAINCAHATNGEPCLSCEYCVAAAAGSFLDIVEVDAASHTGVDNVRELMNGIQFGPLQGKYKVYIIDEVHMLSKAAFNALLKTLEEPPAHAVFILATTEVHKVPVTIVSRTQRFDFGRIPDQLMAVHLKSVIAEEQLEVSDEVLALVTRRSEGGLRDALSLLGAVASLGADASLEEIELLLGSTSVARQQELVQLVTEGKPDAIPAAIENLVERGVDITLYTKDVIEYLRLILVTKLGVKTKAENWQEHHRRVFQAQAAALAIAQVMRVIRLLLRVLKDIETGIAPEVPLLLALVEAVGGPAETTSQLKPGPPAPNILKPAPLAAPLKPAIPPTLQSVNTQLEPSSVPAASIDITFEEVQDKWSEVIVATKNKHSSLGMVLKKTRLLGLTGRELKLAVDYELHRDQLEQSKTLKMLSDICLEVLGAPLLIRPEVQVKAVTNGDEDSGDAVLNDAMKVLGTAVDS